MKLTDVEIKGKSFEVEVDDRGKFRTVLNGDQVTALTLDALKSELAKRISRGAVKIAIPFVRWSDDKGILRKGTITGIHASNRNLLVKWDGQKGVEQEYAWHDDSRFIRPEASVEYAHLSQATDEAQQRLQKFTKLHAFNPHEAVRKALAEQGVKVDEVDVA